MHYTCDHVTCIVNIKVEKDTANVIVKRRAIVNNDIYS